MLELQCIQRNILFLSLLSLLRLFKALLKPSVPLCVCVNGRLLAGRESSPSSLSELSSRSPHPQVLLRHLLPLAHPLTSLAPPPTVAPIPTQRVHISPKATQFNYPLIPSVDDKHGPHVSLSPNAKFLRFLSEKLVICLLGSFILVAALGDGPDECGRVEGGLVWEDEEGKTKDAVKYVQRLVDVEPDEAEWRLLLALCHETMGQLSTAKRLFGEILKESPLLLRALHGLAMVMHKNQEGPAVFEMLNKALELARREKRVTEERNIRILIAQMHVVEGDLNAGLKDFQDLVNDNHRDFRPYLCQLLKSFIPSTSTEYDGDNIVCWTRRRKPKNNLRHIAALYLRSFRKEDFLTMSFWQQNQIHGNNLRRSSKLNLGSEQSAGRIQHYHLIY
ncbi:TPR_REGION domain-containing protein [Psidium guajava]|nr:TPR_REGION domain-containing protein [Psidium guajava]